MFLPAALSSHPPRMRQLDDFGVPVGAAEAVGAGAAGGATVTSSGPVAFSWAFLVFPTVPRMVRAPFERAARVRLIGNDKCC